MKPDLLVFLGYNAPSFNFLSSSFFSPSSFPLVSLFHFSSPQFVSPPSPPYFWSTFSPRSHSSICLLIDLSRSTRFSRNYIFSIAPHHPFSNLSSIYSLDVAKGYIGERCSQTLVQFVKNEEQDLEERVEGAKLLRSITVYRKNKTLGNECASIIHVLHTTTTRALKLALTATLWNLSALAENRGIIVAEHGLEVLSDLLKSGDLGLQREAAGAIRNITLDG